MTRSPSHVAGLSALLLFSVATLARAQCASDWVSLGGMPDTNNIVLTSIEWDPDGAGPLLPRVVLAGRFTIAGDVIANHIVAYEPFTREWWSLGDGLGDAVNALAVLPNGNLVAAGEFTSAGGSPANYIAQWDGSSWQPFGSGMDQPVQCLEVLASGDLVAGGWFANAGGVPADKVAQWDGAQWLPLGTGLTYSWPFSSASASVLHVRPNGDLLVAGDFSHAGGVAADGWARWDGTQWSAGGLASAFTSAYVGALATLPSGELVASGSYVFPGSSTAVAVVQWDGTAWSQLGMNPPADAGRFALDVNGDLLVCGSHRVARFDGVSWSPVGSVPGGSYNLGLTIAPLATGELIVGGSFATVSGQLRVYAQRFDGTSWGRMSTGLNNQVAALATLPTGELIVGGAFLATGGLPTDYIAKWDGTSWSPVGGGIGCGLNALAVMPNGDVIAGGWFVSAGGASANHVARWNGSYWSPLGGGFNHHVRALLVTQAGDLIATGSFTTADGASANRIAKWDGASWTPLGGGLTSSFWLASGECLCEMPNGDIVVGGSFAAAGGVATDGLARWDGSTWSAMGLGATVVLAVASMPNGDLIAAGGFQQIGGVTVNNIAQFDGTTWSPLGGGADNSVSALLPQADGGLIATGVFTTIGGVPAQRIARWDGTAWSAFGDGLGTVGGGFGVALAQMPNGDVMVGGHFLVAGGQGSAFLAQLSPSCPATVTSVGAGCTGTGGANVLTAATLPWLGTTCTLVGNGMPANGLVVGVRGLALTSLPLAAVLPQAIPGCSLLVTPDLLELHLAIGGQATESFYAPNTTALLNQTLHEQFVAFDLDATGTITALTSSNALSLTFGVF